MATTAPTNGKTSKKETQQPSGTANFQGQANCCSHCCKCAAGRCAHDFNPLPARFVSCFSVVMIHATTTLSFNSSMDLLQLGNRSRKTGLKPRDNLSKDQYDMEDVDEFFDDGFDRTVDGAREGASNLHNVARRIDFTEADTATFNLLPILISLRSKRDKRLPLRLPLQEKEKNKTRAAKSPLAKHNFLEGPEYDFNDGDDYYEPGNDGFSPVDLSSIKEAPPSPASDRTPKTSSKPTPKGAAAKKNAERASGRGSNKGSRPLSKPASAAASSKPTPKTSSRPTPKAASFTRTMALGKARQRPRANPHVDDAAVDGSDEDGFDDIFEDNYKYDAPGKASTRKRGSGPKETILRPSPLPSPPPDGLRRSRRTKIAPLAFWRNERIVYSRANNDDDDPDSTLINDIRRIPLQEIKEVVHIPDAATAVGAKKRSRSRSRTTPPKMRKVKKDEESYDYESDPEIAGLEWFARKSLPVGFDTQDGKSLRTIAWTPDGGDFVLPRDADGDESYKIATLFDADRHFIAGGLLDFPFEGFKSLRDSGDKQLMCHVVKGLIEVTLNSTTFVVTRGCSFEVPRDSSYGFRNLGQDSARLFFVQSQHVERDED